MANTDRYRRDEQYGPGDRGFVDRAADEVKSWFGDDDAEVRRRRDEREQPGGAWHAGDRGNDRPSDRGRAWADRSDYEDRRNQRVFPELADTRYGRAGEGYGGRGWDRGGDWGDTRRRSWPEDRGDTTPWHGQGTWRDTGDTRGMGATHGGWHVGKGPSGYQRSDERIREDVCDRLTDDPYVDATHIEVSVQAGEVTLSGAVDRREDKRRAEDIAERISGVREVSNRLRVGSGIGGTLSGDTGSTTSVTR